MYVHKLITENCDGIHIWSLAKTGSNFVSLLSYYNAVLLVSLGMF